MCSMRPLGRAWCCLGLYVRDGPMHGRKGVQCQAARMETECPDQEPS